MPALFPSLFSWMRINVKGSVFTERLAIAGRDATAVACLRAAACSRTPNSPIKQRLPGRDITADAFKWDFETSPDGGTWNPQATIDYRRA
jgi:hypothetical protein